MKFIKLFTLLFVLFGTSISFAQQNLQTQETAFLNKNLQNYLDAAVPYNNYRAELVQGSVQLSQPLLFSLERSLNPLEYIQNLFTGNKYCTRVRFKVVQNNQRLSGEVYLFIQNSNNDNIPDLKYSEIFGGNPSIKIQMVNGCWGLSAEAEPVLNLIEDEH